MNKRKPISKKLREQVYQKYNGHCAYCGCELEIKDMQVDHVLSVARAKWIKDELDLNNIDNLMPSCRSCNYYKDTCSIETFRKNLIYYRKKTSHIITKRFPNFIKNHL